MSQTVYTRIYALVQQIPSGKVAAYGQIAAMIDGCTARMVGYAMAAAPDDQLPWHRVINAQGKISPRGNLLSSEVQRLRLQEEGVHFDAQGRVNWKVVRWQGPTIAWLLENGFEPPIG